MGDLCLLWIGKRLPILLRAGQCAWVSGPDWKFRRVARVLEPVPRSGKCHSSFPGEPNARWPLVPAAHRFENRCYSGS